MTKFLPFRSIVYHSPLSFEEATDRLARQVEETLTIFDPVRGSDKKFKGRVDGNEFSIKEIIRHRNAFLPRIEVKIEPDGDGAIIQVMMRLSYLTLFSISLWMGFAFFALLTTLSPVLYEQESLQVYHLAPLLFFFFGYLITILGFNSGRSEAEGFFERLFKVKKDALQHR